MFLLMGMKAKAVIAGICCPRALISKESHTRLDSGAKSQDDLMLHLSSVIWILGSEEETM